MKTTTITVPDDSPFHRGELALQTRYGSRESLASAAGRAIRNFMPDQHREFYEQLPFIIVGSVDEQGNPWASLLSGKPGFISSPDPTRLHISASALPQDPLAGSLAVGKRLGLLGLEPASRRRNRVNTHVVEISGGGFALEVDQSFGNCPQYIQRRTIDFIRDPGTPAPDHHVETLSSLDTDASALVARSDTFFVASHVDLENRPDREGVDVSHRGGQPGFIKVEGDTLTIPDYAGNRFFNTLGNFLVNPRAGLLFVDFDSGDTLQLSGSVELLDENDPAIRGFKGAERGWRFHCRQGLRTRHALPFRSSFMDYSPNSLMTGSWEQVDKALAEDALRDQWRAFKVTRIVDESTTIRSFHVQPDDGDGLIPGRAGQHLHARVSQDDKSSPLVRSYTLSSAPGDDHYRFSVKRELSGKVSSYLHEHLHVGSRIEIKAPAGDFWLDPEETRPAVLLAAGVGITPMIAMAREVVQRARLSGQARRLTILHSCRTSEERAFAEEFLELQRDSNAQLRYYRILSQPVADQTPTDDPDRQGRIDSQMLRSLLPLDDYDFLLCGPSGFMQALYEQLRSLGVPDHRIQAESFGPSSLRRSPATADAPDDGDIKNNSAMIAADESEETLVQLVDSGIEQRWQSGGPTLLELAEANGLTPDHGCRRGSCGSCTTRLISGKVTYRGSPAATTADDEVLICCAVPARGEQRLRLGL